MICESLPDIHQFECGCAIEHNGSFRPCYRHWKLTEDSLELQGRKLDK